MYPDKRLNFLSKQSCSNFYKLMHDLKHNPCCLALGAGASATVGLPVWSHLLKRICHCYFEEWLLDIASGKGVADRPPSNVSIGLTDSYKLYELEKENPELIDWLEHVLDGAEIINNKRTLPEEQADKIKATMKKFYQSTHQSQDIFMKKVMSGDLTIIAQMIKNQIRPRDWNYLIRKSLYSSYEYSPYVLRVSILYEKLIKLVTKYEINNIINYNYDDTFYHALKQRGVNYKICCEQRQGKGKKRIFYPHGYIPMKGGIVTEIVLSESDYQNQIYKQNLWSNNIQINLLSTNTNIFIGLSLNDSNIRRIINMCSSMNDYMHYAFLPSSGEDKVSIMYDSLCDKDLFRLGIRVIRYSPLNNHCILPELINFLCELS